MIKDMNKVHAEKNEKFYEESTICNWNNFTTEHIFNIEIGQVI